MLRNIVSILVDDVAQKPGLKVKCDILRETALRTDLQTLCHRPASKAVGILQRVLLSVVHQTSRMDPNRNQSHGYLDNATKLVSRVVAQILR